LRLTVAYQSHRDEDDGVAQAPNRLVQLAQVFYALFDDPENDIARLDPGTIGRAIRHDAGHNQMTKRLGSKKAEPRPLLQGPKTTAEYGRKYRLQQVDRDEHVAGQVARAGQRIVDEQGP